MALTALELAYAEQDVASLAAVVNGSAGAPDVVTRTGQSIKTLARVIAEAQSSGGFEPSVAYGAGLAMIRSSQTVTYGGDTYSANPAALPFVTGAVFDPAQWNLLVAKDLLTRAQLKALPVPPDGTVLYMVDGIKTGPFRYTNLNIKTFCDADPRGGMFETKTGTDGSTGGWVRVFDGDSNARWWGWLADDNGGASTNNLPALQAARDCLRAVRLTGVHIAAYGNGGSVGLRIDGAGYIGGEWVLDFALPVLGRGAGVFGGAGSQIRFPAGSNCIVFDAGSEGFTLDGFTFYGGWNPSDAGPAGDEGEYHAVVKHTKGTVRNLQGYNLQGDLVHDDSSGGGNTNDDIIISISGQGCRATYQARGADSNNKTLIGLRGVQNRMTTVWERSGLGNNYHGVGGESNGAWPGWVGVGSPNRPASGVWKNAAVWVCIGGREAQASVNSPPANTSLYDANWIQHQVYLGWTEAAANAAGFPTWVNGITVRPGCAAIIHQGDSNRSTFSGDYFESNVINQFDLNCGLVIGGAFGGSSGNFTVSASTGVYFPTYLPPIDLGHTRYGSLTLVGTTTLQSGQADIGLTSGVAADLNTNLNTTNQAVLSMKRYNAGGALLATDFYLQSAFGNPLFVAVGTMTFYAGGVRTMDILSTGLSPGADNTLKLGDAGTRWSTVYAGTGAINTSDARFKRLLPIDDKVLDAWADVEWIAHQWLDAIAQKGEDKARIHFGVTAQQVRAALDKHGIDGFRYGVLCYDEWQHLFEPEFSEESYTVPVKVEVARPAWNRAKHKTWREHKESLTTEQRAGFKIVISEATRKVTKLDPKGKPVMKIIRRAGNSFGIRYEEALALEAAFQRRRADRVELRLAALETTVERLAAQ